MAGAKLAGGSAGDETPRDKLADVGLVEQRGAVQFGPFIDDYIALRTDVKLTMATVYGRHTRRNLIGYFGAGKPLRSPPAMPMNGGLI